jgi:glycosyltransferase involved in cell wall biosynthesis
LSKNIVIVSNYYPPEMGAAANRIKNLAEGLEKKGNKVTVVCPLPNYPEGKIFKNYKKRFVAKEKKNSVLIKRFWVFPSKSKNSIVRLVSMLSFSWSLWFSLFSFLKKKPDIFIIQSPPLLVGLSGLLLAKLLGCKRILNVSDIWPLSALELGVIEKGRFYNFLEKIEKLNYKLADKIVAQSNETISHINKIVNRKTLVYRNVPSFKKYKIKEKSNGQLKIVYAGLLGYAQGILEICKSIEFKKLNAEFHIYGAGMDKDEIEKIAEKENNIFFHGVVSPSIVKEKIRLYDVSLVPLKNRIYGAVPSKIFELMQLGVPIIFLGEGEGELLVKQNKLGMVSTTNDFDNLKEIIKSYGLLKKNEYCNLSKNSLESHEKEFRLDYQLDKFVNFIEK